MLGLAAYVAAVLSACEASSGTFKCFTDGRTRPELRHTIGFLACPLYLGICLPDGGSFADLLKLLTEEYCRAYEHADHFYLESLEWRPAFLASHSFNWIPQTSSGLEIPHTNGMRDEVSLHPVSFENPLFTQWSIDSETIALFVERPNDIFGQVLYRKDRISRGLVERFAASFSPYIEALLGEPRMPLTHIRILQ